MCTAWRVSLEPTPAVMLTPAGRSWTASCTTRRCSSSLSVDASPVVPQTTKPSEPCAARWCSRSTNACSSTFRSSSNGVTIAVRMAPSPATAPIVPGSAGKRIAARHLGRSLVAAVDRGSLAGRGGRGHGRRRRSGCLRRRRGRLGGTGGLGRLGHRLGGLRGRVRGGRGRLRRRRRRRAGLLLAVVEVRLDFVELGLRLAGERLGALLQRAVLGLLLRLLGELLGLVHEAHVAQVSSGSIGLTAYPRRVPETASLAAEIVAVRWRADDGGFAVLAAVADDGAELTLTGPIAHLHEGDSVEVEGAWREHPKFGRQLHVEQVRVGAPTSTDALLTLLESIKHVGPKGAEWLVARHGDEVLEIVDRDPGARLREVPGIGKAKLKAAVASWQQQAGGRALRMLLAEHDVPAAVAARVHKALGGGALALLQEDPYALSKVEGIAFATADAVARALGTPADAPERIHAALHDTLRTSEQDGHCFLPRSELVPRSARLLELPADVVAAHVEDADLVLDGAQRVLEPRMDRTEHRLAERIRELAAAPPTLDVEVPAEPEVTDPPAQ